MWGNTQSGLYIKMDSALQRAVRIINNNRSASLDFQCFELSGIFNFKNILAINNVCRIFNIISNNDLPYYCNTTLANDNAVHSTRNATHRKIIPIKHTKVSDSHCFSISAVSTWNSLPYDVTMLSNFNSFKTKSESVLLSS